jgi:hypothetical protein
MKRLGLATMIVGLLLVVPAFVRAQSPAAGVTTEAYVATPASQAVVTPVRWGVYHGGPGWYGPPRYYRAPYGAYRPYYRPYYPGYAYPQGYWGGYRPYYPYGGFYYHGPGVSLGIGY